MNGDRGRDEVETFFKPDRPAPKRRGHNSTLPAAVKPISPMSSYRRKELEGYDQLREAVKQRAGGRCEVANYGLPFPGCTGVGVELHHITPRSLGGGHTPENTITTCRPHHDFLEANPLANKCLADTLAARNEWPRRASTPGA